MAQSQMQMSLKYDGTAVDDGTMPVEDVIVALQGFSGAYGKVASSVLAESSHEIRVSAFTTGSFDLNIVGLITSAGGQEALQALGYASKAAAAVYSIVKGYIELKKHVKSKRYEITIEGSNNTVLVINADGTRLEATRESIELLQSKLIDSDLAKMVKPLDQGRVDKMRLSATEDDETSSTIITSDDKMSFALQSDGETFQTATLTGTLISNNKDTRKGTFATGASERVPYHYIGKQPELFQATYAFSGSVRVSGTAYFDENLKLKRIDITDAVRIQRDLDLSSNSPRTT